MAKELTVGEMFDFGLKAITVNSPDYCEQTQSLGLDLNKSANETTIMMIGAEPAAPVKLPEIRPLKVTAHGYHQLTAYTSEAAQTDDDPCTTANGFNLCNHGVEDTVAANFLKFGTKVKIPELFGDRVFIVRDRMNRRHADRLDVWMKDKSQALKFGIKLARIEVIDSAK